MLSGRSDTMHVHLLNGTIHKSYAARWCGHSRCCLAFSKRVTNSVSGKFLAFSLGVVLLPLGVAAAQAPPSRFVGNSSLPSKPPEVGERFLTKRVRPHPGTISPGSVLMGRRKARQDSAQQRLRARTALTAAHRNAATGQTFPGIQQRPSLPAGAIPTAIVTGDFNGDSFQDFVVASGNSDELWFYAGLGDGTFRLPSVIPLTKGLTPVSMIAADLAHRGILDLIVAEYDSQSIGVLRGNGDGTFGYETEYSVPALPAAVVADDFTGSGNLDLVVAMQGSCYGPFSNQCIALLPGDGTGNFGTPVISAGSTFNSPAGTVFSGDVNGDGLPDLLITSPGDTGAQIFINNGQSGFTVGQQVLDNGAFTQTSDGRLADLNGDGCLDAAVANAYGSVATALGDCKGNFGNTTLTRMGDGAAAIRVADVDGDGNLDLVTTSLHLGTTFDVSAAGADGGTSVAVALGDGKGNFQVGRGYVGPSEAFSLAVADFNRDGHPDIVTADTETDTATVFLNNGTGDFGFPEGIFYSEATSGAINDPFLSMIFADLNGDGKPDMLAIVDSNSNQNYHVAALLNDGTGRFSPAISSDMGVLFGTMPVGDFRTGDFRNTGHPDLIAVGQSIEYSFGSSFVIFMPGNGDGSFGTPLITTPAGADALLAVGDFNRDGKLDFVAVAPQASLKSKAVSTFLGNGNGTFTAGAVLSFADGNQDISRCIATDVNHDGKLDIIVYTTANGYGTANGAVWVFLGNGDGTFQSGQVVLNGAQPVSMADLNGDGLPDLVSYASTIQLGSGQGAGVPNLISYLNKGGATFNLDATISPYAGDPIYAEPYLEFGDPLAGSLLHDFNGNGTIDVAAAQVFLSSTGVVGIPYLQFLSGNGDGTFLPTYNVYPFNTVGGYPQFATDLNGDGIADMVELDGIGIGMRVYKGVPAQSLQIGLAAERFSGGTGCGWVYPNVAGATDQTVTLSTSVTGIELASSLVIPAGVLAQQFCFTVEPAYNYQQVFDINATLGTDTATAYGSISYALGYEASVSPTTKQTIYPGFSAAPVTLTLTADGNYSSTVNLSCTPLSAGESCTFGSPQLTVAPGAPASTTVVFTSAASDNGSLYVPVVASDANFTKRATFLVDSSPLFDNVDWPTIDSTSPGVGTDSVSFFAIPPYSLSCSGLPSGAVCAFSANGQDSSGDSFTVTTPAGIAAGNYPFQVVIASSGMTYSSPATLAINDFVLGSALSPAWGIVGTSIQTQITVTGENQINAEITLTCSTDFGATCTAQTAGVAQNSTFYSIVSITVPAGTATGTHNVTITGTYGQLVHSATYPFTVADFSGTLSGNSLSLQRSGTATLTATLMATTGFTGTVSLSCSASSQISCSFSPNITSPGAGSPTSVKVTFFASSVAKSLPPSRHPALVFALALTCLPVFGLLAIARMRRKRLAAVIALAFTMLLVATACGGGGTSSPGGGGGGGTNMYSITVSATEIHSGAQRTVGTVALSVTH